MARVVSIPIIILIIVLNIIMWSNKYLQTIWLCVGDKIVVSKLTSALRNQGNICLGGHMIKTDWYIYTCQDMNMYERHRCGKGFDYVM